MKKGIKIIGILLAIILLSGCYKINTSMSINSDKSMNFEMIYAIDKNEFEGFEEETDEDGFEDFKKEAMEKGFDVENYNYEDDSHKWDGVKLTKKYKNIDDVTKDTEKVVSFFENSDEGGIFDDSQLFSKNGNTYKANFLFDFGDNSSMDESESYASSFDMKFSITLPNASISDNATRTENDGKTLIWDLDITKKNEVNFKFKIDSDTTYKNVTSISSDDTVLWLNEDLLNEKVKNENGDIVYKYDGSYIVGSHLFTYEGGEKYNGVLTTSYIMYASLTFGKDAFNEYEPRIDDMVIYYVDGNKLVDAYTGEEINIKSFYKNKFIKYINLEDIKIDDKKILTIDFDNMFIPPTMYNIKINSFTKVVNAIEIDTCSMIDCDNSEYNYSYIMNNDDFQLILTLYNKYFETEEIVNYRTEKELLCKAIIYLSKNDDIYKDKLDEYSKDYDLNDDGVVTYREYAKYLMNILNK